MSLPVKRSTETNINKKNTTFIHKLVLLNEQNFYAMAAYYYIGRLESFITVRNYTNK